MVIKPMTQVFDVDVLVARMATDLQSKLSGLNDAEVVVIGIRTGGVWLAEALCRRLSMSKPVGELDISFYRDDFTRIGLNPRVKPSSLPFPTEGKHVVLVDDVIMSGRTVRAALNELFDFGRPASIFLVELLDVGGREIPIQPDVLGEKMTLSDGQRVKLTGPQPLTIDIRDSCFT